MMMEPSDSQECKDFTKAAFALSEKFDIPVIIRVTTRICHAKSIVELGEKEDFQPIKYERNFPKFAMLPANAVRRHAVVEPNLLKIEEYANDCPFNVVEKASDNRIGIITSGVSYQHAKEVFGDTASYLKIGLSYPLPRKLIKEFASSVEKLYVIEENDPYLETMVKSLGFTNAVGKEKITCQGELNAEIIREALTDAGPADTYHDFIGLELIVYDADAGLILEFSDYLRIDIFPPVVDIQGIAFTGTVRRRISASGK